jgi:hypothetical protein
MAAMTDQLHSQNLVPFKKRRGPYHIPGMTGENEEHVLEVDRNLDPEEVRFIRHYLGYADTLLKNNVDGELEPKKEISAQNIQLVKASGETLAAKDQLAEEQPSEDQPPQDRLPKDQHANDQLNHENPADQAA